MTWIVVAEPPQENLSDLAGFSSDREERNKRRAKRVTGGAFKFYRSVGFRLFLRGCGAVPLSGGAGRSPRARLRARRSLHNPLAQRGPRTKGCSRARTRLSPRFSGRRDRVKRLRGSCVAPSAQWASPEQWTGPFNSCDYTRLLQARNPVVVSPEVGATRN